MTVSRYRSVPRSRSDNGGDTIVGDNGEAYLAGLALSGTLNAQWGEGAGQQCKTDYQIPGGEDNKEHTGSPEGGM